MGYRTIAAVAVVGALFVGGQGAAFGVATPPASTAWAGYATASTLHVNVLQVGAAGPLVEDTSLAFSGASVSSRGQATSIVNEMGLGVQPADANREAYGRGSGVEAGLNQRVPNDPDANQVVLGARAEAGAQPLNPAEGAPNPSQTPVVTRELLARSVNPLAYASVLRGQALTTWNERYTLPMLGSPLGFGLGFADDVQLLNAGQAGSDGRFSAPVIATDTAAASGERTTSQSFSMTYLVNNGDGTCGLASETRQTIAPLRLNLPPDANAANDVTIELLGEWRLRAIATGKPGGGKIEYAPVSGGPSVPVLRIIRGNEVTNVLNTAQFFGAQGLTLPGNLAPVIALAVGEDPRAIAAPTSNPDPASQPTVTDTEVSGAVDVVRLRLLQPSAPAAGLNALDLRLGHMETKVSVPAGGINCEIPVTKSGAPDPARAGDEVTFTINVPAEDLVPFPCEMTAIRLVDTVSVERGSPRFTVTGGRGPNGEVGTVSGNTVTFDNIGTYRPGSPPLQATVTIRVADDTQAGRLRDEVRVTATPSNCKARTDVVGAVIGGDAFLGGAGANLTGQGVTGGGSATDTLRGDFTLSGPEIEKPAELPATGRAATGAALAAVGVSGAVAFAFLRRRSTRVA